MDSLNIAKPALFFDPETGQTGSQPFHNPSHLAEKTIVILGVARGGTTMVAGVVQRSGIDIGSDLPVNLEDPVFSSVPMKEKDKVLVVEGLQTNIKLNNETKPIWGWKYPRAEYYLHDIADDIRNPHYIIVWRDLLAISNRSVRRGQQPITAMRTALRLIRKNLQLMPKLNGPVMNVSYEKSLMSPIDLIEQVQQFTGVHSPYDKEELLEFCRPGSYKEPTPV